jgi:hypothetical protein
MRDIWGDSIVWDELLWRYFKTNRFIDTLQRSMLYFAAIPQFADRFEGATAVLTPDFPIDPRFAQMEPFENAFFRLRKFKKVSCWHRADCESDAMWKLYAEQSKGVAICTTADRMRRSVRPYRVTPRSVAEELLAGAVRYEDLLSVRLPQNRELYFSKHRAFSWEREFRLFISLDSASEWVPETPQEGIEVEFDLDILIEQIMLGPELSEQDRENIIAVVESAGFKARLHKSSLLGQPRFI